MQKIKLLMTGTQTYEEQIFKQVLQSQSEIEITYCKERLNEKTSPMAMGYAGAICFVNDDLKATCLQHLKQSQLKVLFLRSAGYNHVDLTTARDLGLSVYRVPAYSPEAVAEHALTLLMTLNRKVHKSYNRVREMNFSLDGLVGFNLQSKTVGIVGTGKIGRAFAKILSGFGCRILLYDIHPDNDLSQLVKGTYVSKEELLQQSDIISFHCPLTAETQYFINQTNLAKMKKNIILVNTSRGAIIETKALIKGLKSGQIGGAALDVYEFESELFFANHSSEIISDDLITRLISFPNVLMTAHQGFLTEEALLEIASITRDNIEDFKKYGSASRSENRLA